MDLVIGADGGGTKTACAIADMRGNILGLGYAGPSNHLRLAGGASEAVRAARDGIDAAFGDGGIEMARAKVAYLALGGVGIDRVSPANTEAARAVVDADDVTVDNDAAAGLAAATGELYGVVIVAGTGSIAMAVDRSGMRARSSGWGYRFGDEGSGQYIGRLGLEAAARCHDGRGPATSLVDRVLARYHIDTVDGLRSVLYRQPVNNRDIADFCPDVVAAARDGDQVAMEITQKAGRELALAAWAAAHRLGMDSAEFPVVPCGGVFVAGDVIIAPFEGELKRLASRARIVYAPYPPVVGAVILALSRAGIAAEGAVRDNLERSWKEVSRRHERIS